MLKKTIIFNIITINEQTIFLCLPIAYSFDDNINGCLYLLLLYVYIYLLIKKNNKYLNIFIKSKFKK